MDYWHLLNVCYYDNLTDFFEKTEGARYFYATTKAPHTYVEAEFKDNDYILFGREDAGLPEELFVRTRRTLYKNTYDRRGEKS